jgi:hypothetical protein
MRFLARQKAVEEGEVSHGRKLNTGFFARQEAVKEGEVFHGCELVFVLLEV